jgi:pyrroline-5-carboxylate reductase
MAHIRRGSFKMALKIKLLQVGCGNMGRAILSAWAEQGLLDISWVVQPSLSARDLFKPYPQINFVSSQAEIPSDFRPEILVFANKPQASDLVPKYAHYRDAIFVSLMAGVSLEWLHSHLGQDAQIARLMPNLAARHKASMSLLASDTRYFHVQALGEALGKILWVDREEMLEFATPISGSGPAYYFLLTEALIAAAVKLGFEQSQAELLATQTLVGSAITVEREGHPDKLRKAVSSPGGVTLEALKVLNTPDDFVHKVEQAVEAAIKHAKRLAEPKQVR